MLISLKFLKDCNLEKVIIFKLIIGTKMSFSNFIFCLIILSVFLINGCTVHYNYHCIEFKDKNPTKYDFNFNMQYIRRAIIKNETKLRNVFYEKFHFLDEQTSLQYFLNLERPEGSLNIFDPFQKMYIRIETNSIDFYLITIGYTKFSELCFNDKTFALIYIANFQIHFNRIDDFNTQIEIITLYPRIITGIDGSHIGIHFERSYFETPTEPSTIEEYEILLKIGEILGVKDEMPKCKYPILQKN